MKEKSIKIITEEVFTQAIGERLGAKREEALEVFKKYGPKMSQGITNVFLHALDKNMVDTVLKKLNKHHEEHLQYHHPDIKGEIEHFFGNKTEIFFEKLYKETLGLQAKKKIKPAENNKHTDRKTHPSN